LTSIVIWRPILYIIIIRVRDRSTLEIFLFSNSKPLHPLSITQWGWPIAITPSGAHPPYGRVQSLTTVVLIYTTCTKIHSNVRPTVDPSLEIRQYIQYWINIKMFKIISYNHHRLFEINKPMWIYRFNLISSVDIQKLGLSILHSNVSNNRP